MSSNLIIKQVYKNKSEICSDILRSLPQWFGIESAIKTYIKQVKNKPTFIAKIDDNIIGFISLHLHNKYSAEIYVMGIKKEFHKKGIGKKLTQKAIAYLKQKNYKFLSVKTLSPSKKNKAYEQTRKFYKALGFYPIEEFKNIWDENNPCLLMIKAI
ncbi:MAG: Mycothiol acetyltransferase [Candidatus Anoxychlamydiales bacterium]|nr:Mycothiol acetyltransferase [Candidatus Anoxychlamydiales bacterium]